MGFYGRVGYYETDIFLRSCFWIFCRRPIFLAFWLTAPTALPHRYVSAIVRRLRPLFGHHRSRSVGPRPRPATPRKRRELNC